MKTQAFELEPGMICGVHQVARGYVKGEDKVCLEMQAYLGCEKPRDIVTIQGEPNLQSVIEGGVNGDIATVAAVINAIPIILRSKPGLRTVADIALTSYCGQVN
jgi:hypothetical protein